MKTCTQLTILVGALCASTTALATGGWETVSTEDPGQHWGEFKDNGCVGPMTHPGLRSMSAVLHNVPPGTTWEAACTGFGATINGLKQDHPALCVNTSPLEPLLLQDGFGGIDSGDTAVEKIRAGASVIQIYTGLVYEGPALLTRIKSALDRAIRSAGATGVGQLVASRRDDWADRPFDD